MIHWISVYWVWVVFYGGILFLLFLLRAYQKEWKTPFLGRWISDEFQLIGTVRKLLVLPSGVIEITLEQPPEPIPGGQLTERQRGLNQRYATRDVYAYMSEDTASKPEVSDVVSLRCCEWWRYVNRDTCSIVFGWHKHIGPIPFAGTVRDEAAQVEGWP